MSKILLSKEALLSKDDLAIEEVDLGNNEIVYVRELTGYERDDFESSLLVEDKKSPSGYKPDIKNSRSKLAVLCICDQNGKRLLELKDALALGKNMGARKLDKIVTAARVLNKMDADEKDFTEKKLEATSESDSNTDSA